MHSLLQSVVGSQKVLLVVAAPVEVRSVLRVFGSNLPVPGLWKCASVASRVDLLHAGVSKSNAAASTAMHLSSGAYSLALSVGIAGALPGSGLGVCDTVTATSCTFGDEGLVSDSGWTDLAAMGFPLNEDGSTSFTCDARVVEAFSGVTTAKGAIAAVSTCSGTDALALEVARRTGALAEAMEGAAMATVAARMGVAFGEVRAMSNHTGSRAHQAWNISGALSALEGVLHAGLVQAR